MVVYGVNGYVSNVPSTVFDQIYAVENGWMELETDLDLKDKTVWSGSHLIMVFKNSAINVKKDIKAHAVITDTIEVPYDTLLYYYPDNSSNLANRFAVSDSFWLKGVQEKLFKVLTSVRIFFVLPVPAAGVCCWRVTQNLYSKPDLLTTETIHRNTREFKKTYNTVLDTSAINVFFDVSGM